MRAAGSANCSRHPKDEKYIYGEALKKLRVKMGDKFPDPPPKYTDLVHIHGGASAGTTTAAVLAMGKTLDDAARYWPEMAPDIIKRQEIAPGILRQFVLAAQPAKRFQNFVKSHFERIVGTISPWLLKRMVRYEESGPRFFASPVSWLEKKVLDSGEIYQKPGWDPHFRNRGLDGVRLSESATSVVYTASYGRGTPANIGIILGELLDDKHKNGILMGHGTDYTHAECIKGATAIPGLNAPVRMEDNRYLRDYGNISNPNAFIGWLATRCPLSDKFNDIVVCYIGSGFTSKATDAEAIEKEGVIVHAGNLFGSFGSFVGGQTLRMMKDTLWQRNGHDQGFFYIDIPSPENGNGFDTSAKNIRKIQERDHATSVELNGQEMERLAELLADNYIASLEYDRAHKSESEPEDTERKPPKVIGIYEDCNPY